MYETANIDRAIVATQFDLRGFWHPLGFRLEKPSWKSLQALTGNLTSFIAGLGKKEGTPATDESFVSYFQGTFEQKLAMCRKIAESCDLSQKEAIQLIVRDILRMSESLNAGIASGDSPASNHQAPLEPTNRWGASILALAEAFEVEIPQAAT